MKYLQDLVPGCSKVGSLASYPRFCLLYSLRFLKSSWFVDCRWQERQSCWMRLSTMFNHCNGRLRYASCYMLFVDDEMIFIGGI